MECKGVIPSPQYLPPLLNQGRGMLPCETESSKVIIKQVREVKCGVNYFWYR